MVDKTTWTVIQPDIDTFKGSIITDLGPKLRSSSLASTIQVALSSTEAIKVLAAAKVTYAQIANLLKMLSIRDQEVLIPIPFGQVSIKHQDIVCFGALPEREKQRVLEKWAMLKPKYQQRMNAVICAILARLVTDYETEIASEKFSHVFILDSNAFQAALRNAAICTYACLYKDVPSKKNNRKACLFELGLGEYFYK
jgi:hypothetical protein